MRRDIRTTRTEPCYSATVTGTASLALVRFSVMSAKRSKRAFTVEFPQPLPVSRDGEHWWTQIEGRELRLSNLDKVFWPDEGYTKGDLLAYYFNIAPLILPYLRGRPLTMKRMPNGVRGDFFYEKEAPSHAPDWMARCAVDSSGSDRWGPPKHEVINYLLVEDAAGLLFMANLGCIEFHPLHSRCGSIGAPDYLFFDLDPFEPATFEDVLAVARLVRVACDRLALRSYPKTSGATGMQVYVPLTPDFTYEQTREFVGRIGTMLRDVDPDRVTMEWEVNRRTGKVFVDHNMNRVGANIAAVYSVRPEPGATVSMPVSWEEVDAGEVGPSRFTIASVWERILERPDPFRGVLDDRQDLSAALAAVGVHPDGEAEATKSRLIPATPGAARVSPESGGRQRDEAEPSAPRSRSAEATARSRDPKLGAYLKKRDFGGTPEPEGGSAPAAGNSFVIQKHDATRLHYDLRLERDGVLVSWAVPKGLPFEKGERRLAVQTEDHPLEYGSFEGTIPKGHYGAGEVRIWDRGTYEALEWRQDKVTFRLHGERHRGEFHLVKTSKGDWLVLLSKSLDHPPRKPPPFTPMLAELEQDPFDAPGWWFEPKFDGVRALVYVDEGSTRLVSRNSRDQTSTYPELARLHERITAVNAVVDGEIVATDESGRTSFELLQQRMNLASQSDVDRVRRKVPVELVAFDILWLDGMDLTREPLERRRERLHEVVVEGKGLRLIYGVSHDGKEFHRIAKQHGLEGVIGKRAGSVYQPGKRSSDWKKIKILNRQDCVILGWTPGHGSRGASFGALLVGAYERGRLVWIGQVGTGYTDGMLHDLLGRLKDIETDRAPIDDPELAKVKGARWTRPELVCVVEYLQVTSARKLRAPSYKGLRTDKLPEDCLLEPT